MILSNEYLNMKIYYDIIVIGHSIDSIERLIIRGHRSDK
jgi:hypothetical protein